VPPLLPPGRYPGSSSSAEGTPEAIVCQPAAASCNALAPIRLQFGSFAPIDVRMPAHTALARFAPLVDRLSPSPPAVAWDTSISPTSPRSELQMREDHRLALLRQCEYYFSSANLKKDRFMRDHMDNDGWVNLRVICSFNRMWSFSQFGLERIARTLASSEALEVRLSSSREWEIRSKREH
jgi:hypothetical protein